jgi:hypothetical protein
MTQLRIIFVVAVLALSGTVAQAQRGDKDWCLYNGKVYSDGSQNPAGQVCDGVDGTWK